MSTFLFDDVIFGPIKSRRLGISLGINLLSTRRKICSFDCLYCECGWAKDHNDTSKNPFPPRVKVAELLEAQLVKMHADNMPPDVITFAGNGEPTLHPDFEWIIDDTIALRDKITPSAKIAVLSNSTMLHKESTVRALKKIEDNILKLDGGTIEMIELIDKPNVSFSLEKLITNLKKFNGDCIIQTMFLRGEYEGVKIDNTVESEVKAWIECLKEINPRMVMIYTIDRDTPVKTLSKVSVEEMNLIADRVRKEIKCEVSVSG